MGHISSPVHLKERCWGLFPQQHYRFYNEGKSGSQVDPGQSNGKDGHNSPNDLKNDLDNWMQLPWCPITRARGQFRGIGY